METTEVQSDNRSSAKSRTGHSPEICFQCRNRKVKCDGNLGGCGNCKRLQLSCSLLESHVEEANAGPSSHLERRRVRRACTECRHRRSKCTGGHPCARCRHLGSHCLYPSSRRAERVRQEGLVPPSPSNTDAQLGVALTQPREEQSSHDSPERVIAGPSSCLTAEPNIRKVFIKQHIDAFFEFVYPIPCFGFLHRATLIKTWSQDKLNPCLLRAICGITSRFLFPDDAAYQQNALTWMQKAENQLLLRLGEPRLSDAEAWFLVTLEHSLSGRFGNILLSMSLMTRIAYIFRLNFEDERLPFLMQERRRRLMWAIYANDTLYSSGRPEFIACPPETIHLQLPCDERCFSMHVSVQTGPLKSSGSQGTPNMGLMAYCVRVLDIRNRTQRLALTMMNTRQPIVNYLDDIAMIEQELQDFRARLPPEYRLAEKNFFLRAYTPYRVTFLMLHVWWHQIHCDLFRFTIPGLLEALPSVEMSELPETYLSVCREKCLSHALSVSKTMEMSMQAGVEIITDPCLAPCAFHSARVISRLGRSSPGGLPKEELVQALRNCADALTKQSRIYPRSRDLREGIIDLIRGTQESPTTSMWDNQESNELQSGGTVPNDQGASKRLEVYSRFSVPEQIRKLHFQPDEDDCRIADQSQAEISLHTLPQPTDTRGRQETRNFTGRNLAFTTTDIPIERRGRTPAAQEGLTQYTSTSDNFFTCPQQHPISFADTDSYDLTVNLDIDPRCQSGQADLFMDFYWPFQGSQG